MLRDTLTNFVDAPFAGLRRPKHESFWALEDDFNEGEVLGLIRRNSEGKTTLLKDLLANYIRRLSGRPLAATLSSVIVSLAFAL